MDGTGGGKMGYGGHYFGIGIGLLRQRVGRLGAHRGGLRVVAGLPRRHREGRPTAPPTTRRSDCLSSDLELALELASNCLSSDLVHPILTFCARLFG